MAAQDMLFLPYLLRDLSRSYLIRTVVNTAAVIVKKLSMPNADVGLQSDSLL